MYEYFPAPSLLGSVGNIKHAEEATEFDSDLEPLSHVCWLPVCLPALPIIASHLPFASANHRLGKNLLKSPVVSSGLIIDSNQASLESKNFHAMSPQSQDATNEDLERHASRAKIISGSCPLETGHRVGLRKGGGGQVEQPTERQQAPLNKLTQKAEARDSSPASLRPGVPASNPHPSTLLGLLAF